MGLQASIEFLLREKIGLFLFIFKVVETINEIK